MHYRFLRAFFPAFWEDRLAAFCHTYWTCGYLPAFSSSVSHALNATSGIFPWQQPHQTSPVLRRATNVSGREHLCKIRYAEQCQLAEPLYAANQAPFGGLIEQQQE